MLPAFFRTVHYLPAGSIVEELLDAFDTYLLFVNKVAKAFEPFNVVLRVVSVFVSPGRLDKAVLFIKAKSLIGGSHKFGGNPNGKKRKIFPLGILQIFLFHKKCFRSGFIFPSSLEI